MKINKARAKTPTILQMEAVECGAAALAMVLGYHQKFIPLEELRIACGVSRDGSKASNIVKAARTYGMVAKGFSKEPEALKEMAFPLIVFWNFNHYIVVEGISNGKVYLNDPASGPRVISEDEFDHSFTGVVLTFEQGPDFKPSGQQSSLIRSLRPRLAGNKMALLYLVLVGLVLVIPGLIIPVFSKVFIDDILVGGMDGWLRPMIIGMLITAILLGTLLWIQLHYLRRLERKIALSSSAAFFWHVLTLPLDFYAQRSAGDIGSRVGINDRVAQLLSGDLASAVLSVITALFFGMFMLAYDVTMTLISMGVVGINVAVLRYVAVRRKELNQRLAIDSGKVMGTSMNGLLLIDTLKASGAESEFFSRWAGYQAKFMNSMQEMQRSATPLSLLPSLLTTINSIVILGIGGMRVIDGSMTMGMLIAFQSLVASFIRPVNQLVSLGTAVQEFQGDIDRLDDVMRYPADKSVVNELNTHIEDTSDDLVKAKLEGYLELRDVSFGYSRLGPPLIQGFNLSLKPGMRVALVGASGCGKSTISKLVMGLYKPWSGEILFDGKPRESWPRRQLLGSISIVDQEIMMFDGTVRENLTMWDKTVPEYDLLRAGKDACIHDDITARPGGYEGKVEEGGGNFSGGQRQRLEIARALASKPRLLVLDEATSALDPATEKLIDDHLRQRGCTCLVIAHRLSTIRDCDEIIALDKGKIIERGTHAELMEKQGYYAQLIGEE